MEKKHERTEEFLNEQWIIGNMKDSWLRGMSYYNGALKVLELAGYNWQRDVDGKHRLWR